MNVSRNIIHTAVIFTVKEPGIHTIPEKARKICAMGIRCSRWVTMHGLALNVNTDLIWFDYIVPCGIRNKKVASMHLEIGKNIPLDEVKLKIQKHFFDLFCSAV